MAALRNGSKCSHTTCMLRFFTVSRLAMNTNLIFEIGSKVIQILKDHMNRKRSGLNRPFLLDNYQTILPNDFSSDPVFQLIQVGRPWGQWDGLSHLSS